MACNVRIIKSPITGKEVESKTWADIHELTDKDGAKTDKLYEQLLSPEFTNWFGDWINDPKSASKVVNEHGEPLLVYHGTHESFNVFDKSKSGDKTGKAKELPGFYFFDHSQPASEYTIDPNGGKAAYQKFDRALSGYEEDQMREMYSDLYTTYDKAPESEKFEGIEGFAWDYFNKEVEKGNVLPVFLSIKTPLIHDNRDKRIETSTIVSKLQPNNDGVKVEGVMDRLNDSIGINDDVYIAFEPNQIKSLFNEGNYSKESDNIYYQAGDTEGSRASDTTVNKWKGWFKDNAVDYDGLTTAIYDEQGRLLDVNEKVDVMNKIVRVIENKENVAIGEAGMHIVTRLVKEKDPKLFNRMMNKVDQYEIYEKVLNKYKDYKNYQTADGKPNIPKIKEEVVGKILNEYYIQREEGTTEKPEMLKKIEQAQSWWQTIKETLSGFFKGNPFTKAVTEFNKGRFNEPATGITEKVNRLQDIAEGEDYESFAKNTISNIKNIANELPENTAIVTHGTAISAIKAWKESGYSEEVPTEEKGKEYQIENGQVEEVIINGKKLYLIRHGESVANVEDKLSDATTPLTVKGKQDALDVAEKLKDMGITQIISTDTERTRSTADILRSQLGLEDVFYQSKEEYDKKQKGKNIFDKLKSLTNLTVKTDKDGNTNYIITENAKEYTVSERVSKYSKEIYERRFGKRVETEKDKVDKDTGRRLHGYIEDVINRSVDNVTGLKKDKIDLEKGTILPGEEHIYAQLEDYMTKVISRFPVGYRFIAEQTVYQKGKRPGKDDLAGTLDFLAIAENGAVHNKDWKFMNEKSWDDISAVTQQAHRTQLSLYGKILRNNYGVDTILESNTVPIKLVYGKDSEQFVLKNIIVGDADYTKINDKTLLPVVSNQIDIINAEGKKDEKMTALFNKLNAVAEKTYNKTVQSKQEQKKIDKQYQNILYAIRSSVLKKEYNALTTVALDMVRFHIKNLEGVEKFVKTQGKEGADGIKDAQDVGKLLDQVIDASASLQVFTDMKQVMHEFTKNMDPVEKDALDKSLTRISDNVKYANNLLFDPLTGKGILEAAGVKIGDAVGIYNILSMDKSLDMLQRNFLTYANAPIKTTQALYKYGSRAEHLIAIESAEEAKVQKTLSDNLTKWMGGTWVKEKAFKTLFKEGKIRKGLVNKNSKDFYEGLKRAKTSNDYEWLKKHINVKEYVEDYEKDLDEYIKQVNDTVFDANSFEEDPTKRAGTLDQQRRDSAIESYKETYDISRDISERNNKIIAYANDNAWSKEYTDLNRPENKAALDFYDYVTKINKRAHESGYLGDYYYHHFPQIRGRVINNFFEQGMKQMGRKVLSNFVVEEGEKRFRDPLTGELIRTIRGRYTHDLGEDAQVSDDIMKALSLYTTDLISYERRKEIEGLANSLLAIEKNKKVRVYERGKLVKSSTGELIGAQNTKNLEYNDRQTKFFLYGEKYVGEEKGFKLGLVDDDLFLSYQKSLDTTVRLFTLKSLGLNLAPALSNLFGGAANQLINSGNHFTKSELAQAYKNVLGGKYYTEEGKKFVALMDKFMPFTEAIAEHLGRGASKEKVLNWLSGDGLMVLLRKGENIIQMANADVYFRNTMVENDKLVNIREYVKNKYEYGNIYNLPIVEQKRIKQLINKEVEELQKTRNLYNDKNIKFDKNSFNVDLGIDMLDESTLSLRQRIQQLTADCIGSRPPGEIAHINMFLFGGALTNFRGWIPRLSESRFGDFKYHAGTGVYEAGRARMLADVLMDHTQSKLKNLVDVISFSNFGGSEGTIVDVAKRQYQRRLTEASEIEGTEESMFAKTVTEAQFVDNYIQSVKAQVRELQAVVALNAAFYSAMAWAKSMKKDDDNYAERGMARYAVRMLDKFSDELGFFYSYASFSSIVGGGGNAHPVPIVTILSDLGKFTIDLKDKSKYLISGDNVEAEKVHLLKYPISFTPGLNQFSQMISMGNKDWNDYIYGENHGKNMQYGLWGK
jgi:broad specificity phosphatase PhoE